MNVARLLINLVAGLTPVAVVATPFASPREKRLLVVVLLAGIGLFTVIGMRRFYRRPPASDDSAANTDKKVSTDT